MLVALEDMVDLLFPNGRSGDALVNFGRPDLHKAILRCYTQAVRNRLTNPEFVFVSRMELGLCSLLHQLRAIVNSRALWERVHKQATSAHSTVTR